MDSEKKDHDEAQSLPTSKPSLKMKSRYGSTVGRNRVQTNETQFARNSNGKSILNKIPDMTNSLANTKIDTSTRARLVNWKIEVLIALEGRLDMAQLFKSMQLTDMYTKHKQAILEDENLHLIGVVCLFIASKYETNNHITLHELVHKACHNKFTEDQFLSMEFEVVKTFAFMIGYPTNQDILGYFFNKMFEIKKSSTFRNLQLISHKLLVACLMEVQFNNFAGDEFCLAVMLVSVKHYFELKFNALKDSYDMKKVERILREERKMTEKIKEFSRNRSNLENLFMIIQQYLEELEVRYDECTFVLKLLQSEGDKFSIN